MKSQQNNKSKKIKKLIISFSMIIAVLVIAAIILVNIGLFKAKTEDSNTTQTTSNNSNKVIDTSPTGSGKTPVNNQPSDNQTTASTVNASITHKQQTNSILNIGTNIEDITSTGTCTITLTKDDKTVTHSVGVQALASTSTCKGFGIPITELSPGLWEIKIDIILTSKEAHLSDSFTIN